MSCPGKIMLSCTVPSKRLIAPCSRHPLYKTRSLHLLAVDQRAEVELGQRSFSISTINRASEAARNAKSANTSPKIAERAPLDHVTEHTLCNAVSVVKAFAQLLREIHPVGKLPHPVGVDAFHFQHVPLLVVIELRRSESLSIAFSAYGNPGNQRVHCEPGSLLTARTGTCWKWKASTLRGVAVFRLGESRAATAAKALTTGNSVAQRMFVTWSSGALSAIFGDVFADFAFLALRKPVMVEMENDPLPSSTSAVDQQQEGGRDAGFVRGCLEQGAISLFEGPCREHDFPRARHFRLCRPGGAA